MVQLQRDNPVGPKVRKGFSQISQQRHTVDQIIAKLRRADVLLVKGTNVPELCKQLEITDLNFLPLAVEIW